MNKQEKTKFTRWDSADYLKTDEDNRLYLQACIEEDAGDGKLIRHAIETIAKARSMTALAKEAGSSRDGLYKALSSDGNPEFATILRITKALGLEIAFNVKDPEKLTTKPRTRKNNKMAIA